jgi:hypothetical protein
MFALDCNRDGLDIWGELVEVSLKIRQTRQKLLLLDFQSEEAMLKCVAWMPAIEIEWDVLIRAGSLNVNWELLQGAGRHFVRSPVQFVEDAYSFVVVFNPAK